MLMQGLQGDRPELCSSVYSHQNNLGLGCYCHQLLRHCPLVMSVGITRNLSTARVLYVPVASCFPFSFKCFLESPHVYLNNDRQGNILFFKLKFSNSSVVVHTCQTSSRGAESGGSDVQPA